MSELQQFDVLQNRAKIIATVSFVTNIIILISVRVYDINDCALPVGCLLGWLLGVEFFEIFFMSVVLVILTNICLYIGATKGNMCLIIPFMALYTFFLVLLFWLDVTNHRQFLLCNKSYYSKCDRASPPIGYNVSSRV